MIETLPWSSCSRGHWSPWLAYFGHTISSTGPSVSPFRDFSDKILRRAQEIAGKDIVDVPGAHSDHRPRPTHPALLTQRASTFHSKAEQVITV